jgi:hypothetical protein
MYFPTRNRRIDGSEMGDTAPLISSCGPATNLVVGDFVYRGSLQSYLSIEFSERKRGANHASCDDLMCGLLDSKSLNTNWYHCTKPNATSYSWKNPSGKVDVVSTFQ